MFAQEWRHIDRVHISEQFAIKVQEIPGEPFKLTKREILDIKGKGPSQTFWLDANDINHLIEKHQETLDTANNIIASDDHSVFRRFTYSYRNKKQQFLALLNGDNSYSDFSTILGKETDTSACDELQRKTYDHNNAGSIYYDGECKGNDKDDSDNEDDNEDDSEDDNYSKMLALC